MNMDILAALPGFILAFILIFCYEYRIKLIKTKPKNNVHFYVARDKNDYLYLHVGKPVRDNFEFSNNLEMYYYLDGDSFKYVGLNEKDYDNLKWEDEPIEVFINLKN